MKLQCLYLWLVAMMGILPAMAQENVGVQFLDKPLGELLLQAKQENKLVFIDCYSTYCGPCKVMLRKEFPKKEMGDYLNADFVSAKMNLDLGEGPELSKKWDVHSFPTFLFLDSDGNILHRMVGYMPADEFIQKAKEGLADNSFRTLEKKYQQGERSREIVVAYMEYLKKVARIQKYYEVMRQFLSDSNVDILSDTLAFSLFCQYITSPYDSIFLNVYQNKKAFVERYGEKAERKLKNVWWEYPHSLTVFEGAECKGFDWQKLQDYSMFMRQHGINAKKVLYGMDLDQACYTGDYGEIWRLVMKYDRKTAVQDGTLYYAFSLLVDYLAEKKDLEKLKQMIHFRQESLAHKERVEDLYPGEQVFPPEFYQAAYQELLNKIEK